MAYTVPDQREVPVWLKQGQQPTQAVAELIRKRKVALAAARNEVDDARGQTAEVVELFGLALYKKLGAANASEFRTLFDTLTAVGAELVTHVGERFEGELEELADVVDWVEAVEGIAPGCVAEAFEPEVRLNGKLIHRAKLICTTEDVVTQAPQDADATTLTGIENPVSDPSTANETPDARRQR